jgi:hypothetical protein
MLKFSRKKYLLSLIILFIIVILIFNLNETLSDINYSHDKNYNELDTSVKVDKIVSNTVKRKSIKKNYYLIVEYTKIFSQVKFCDKRIDDFPLLKNSNKNSERFNLLDDCEFKNCFFTCDKKYVDNADSLLFHYSDLLNDIEKNKNEYEVLIKERKKEQIWMLWLDEAYNVNKNIDSLKLNWTISYYKNSEAYKFAYGGVVPTDGKNNDDYKIENEFNKRSNSAIWFVSNCNSQYRINFANKLGEYYPIIVSGQCSKNLNTSRIIQYNNSCSRESKCEVDFLTSKKFYLALESTNCTDYITEKFWRSLSYGLIPIVIQPSKESYELIAPINSFIHAQDFNFDIKLLAKYLENVSNTFDLYLKHTKWRLKNKVYYKGEDVEPRRFCQLCTKLNTQQSSIYYESISNWFSNQCKSI